MYKNKSRIVLYIIGGLGNKMFQYAAANTYAKSNDKKLVVNIDSYVNYKWKKHALLWDGSSHYMYTKICQL